MFKSLKCFQPSVICIRNEKKRIFIDLFNYDMFNFTRWFFSVNISIQLFFSLADKQFLISTEYGKMDNNINILNILSFLLKLFFTFLRGIYIYKLFRCHKYILVALEHLFWISHILNTVNEEHQIIKLYYMKIIKTPEI